MFNCYLSNYLLNDSKYKDLADNKLFDGLAIPNSYIVTNVACNQCKESEEYEDYKHYQQLEKLENNPIVISSIIDDKLINDFIGVVDLNRKYSKATKDKKTRKKNYKTKQVVSKKK